MTRFSPKILAAAPLFCSLAFLISFSVASHAQDVFAPPLYVMPPPPPPPPIVAHAPAPGPGYVWISGYWYPAGSRWHWRAGYWARPPYARAYWVAPHYYGGRYYAGYWRMPNGSVNPRWAAGQQPNAPQTPSNGSGD